MKERGTDSADRGRVSTRPYEMRARREAVDRTRERILDAMADLWLTRHYDDLNLADVAERAGVSRQTVHRHYGTKDELLIAMAEWKGPQGEAEAMAAPGDVEDALSRLMDLYETIGDATVRALGLEGRIDAMDHLLKRGRRGHRAWIEHVFEPWLPAHGSPDREVTVMSLYAATDIMQWKLLRRDFDSSAAFTQHVIRRLVDGVLEAANQKGENQ